MCEKLELWIRRAIVSLAWLLSSVIFLVLGGLVYVFMIALATIALTLANFIAAMTGTSISGNVRQSLRQSILFFPSGFGTIWDAARAAWNN